MQILFFIPLLIFQGIALSCFAQQYSLLPYKEFKADVGKEWVSMDISLDGQKLLLTDLKGSHQLWDIDQGKVLNRVSSKTGFVFSSFTKEHIIALSSSGKVIEYNLDLSELNTLEVDTKPGLVSLDPDKKILAIYDLEGNLILHDLGVNMGYANMDSREMKKTTSFIGFDRFGQYLAQITDRGDVKIWDPSTQKTIKQLVLQSGEYSGSKSVIHSATVSRGSDYFIVGLQEVFIPKGGLQPGRGPERRNMVIVYDWQTGNEVKRIKINDRADQIIAGPGPENLIYISEGKKEVNLVNITTSSIQSKVSLPDYPNMIKLSEDNELLVVGSNEGTLSVFEIQRNTAAKIQIIEPDIQRSIAPSESEESSINVRGKIEGIRTVRELSINGEPADLNNSGEFTTAIDLYPGKNKIRIQATDHENNRITRDIFVTRKLKDDHSENSNTSHGVRKKIALVIGNSNYSTVAELENPSKDAQAMEKTLKDLGFEVTTLIDAGYEEMKNAVYRYGDQINDVDVSLFYYAGHGLEVDGVNYLVPVDASISSSLDVKTKTLPLTGVLRTVDYANDEGLNMIILDACRNNPFPTGRRGGAGLARERATSGTLIAYATEPGATASDGEGDNGLYTGELVKQLAIRQRIEDVFINTRNSVEEISNGEQKPWEEARLKGIFYLK